MKIFLTGGSGYFGSILAPLLCSDGHDVRILDLSTPDYDLTERAVFMQGDFSQCKSEWLEGTDAVIHLAAFSNDRSADADPEAAWRVNVLASEALIEACQRARVPRFIQASTCSVYGWQPTIESDEESPAVPVGNYAQSKFALEQALHRATSPDFCVFILRKPTLHGWSPRMRTDVVVNSMLRWALTTGIIPVHNPEVWRPVLHVRDAAHAYLCALAAPKEMAGVYNVHFANYRLIDIALEVQSALREKGWEIEVQVESQGMPMSYRVRSEKMRQRLRFNPTWSVKSSVHEMVEHAFALKKSGHPGPPESPNTRCCFRILDLLSEKRSITCVGSHR